MAEIDKDIVLIANRGEIALRIIRACRRLGLRAVCAYSEGDRGAAYLDLADQAICVGPAPAMNSYLNIPALLAAADATGAGFIHPGYGFLSESPEFAEAVRDAGLTLIGPSADVMRMMGDKVQAKRAMMTAGVPCVPGPDSVLSGDLPEISRVAEEIGYPVILKAAGGGGGRGMRMVRQQSELRDAYMVTRQEAQRFFGNPGIYMEKFLERPRHVEIQVIADSHGNALWLGDRDCSMQRRHQKMIEEAPAPGIDRDHIAEIGARCAESCREIGYTGAGTFEFLYEDGQFYFIEMNTRIQVEHPVTEMVTGLDIVALQIDVARGGQLPYSQAQIHSIGHAIECRINAEDPDSFAPSPGRITAMHVPGGPGIRMDSHVCAGEAIPASYDSMIGKVIAHGRNRAEALARARSALSEMRIEGVASNLPLHRELLADPGFREGGVSIHHLENWLAAREKSDG
ncbi:acetyl-CoA carboxylase biotin carboxylase subunit [Paracoccus saliphilus]|uniref:Biotin carboxylase n=1 Tax=Paracoccus saliphilus TaxID=405559 RepID=A0AA45W7T2_9RHOB|nr:acetyl-CoA carboxylase biotin carboxylase subunit [Paracoccus saliphilus]WCR01574.1 acetyl-CoA carboxylase biotin carboxylase subunit [Paracoccus saliphilus]SIT12279.1 acetyl-CoA carboxylase, biotin carboxylase subunit [Paracoccus saliphilus]